MTKKIILAIIILLYSIEVYSISLADELKEAQKNSEEIYGDKLALSICDGMYTDYSYNTVSLIIPIGPIYRIKPEIGIIYDSEDISGKLKFSLQIGSPPSSEKIRLYGGPLIDLNSTLDDNIFDHAVLSLGGCGGAEFYINELSSCFLEFGGSSPIYENKNTLYGFGTFFTGGINFYLN